MPGALLVVNSGSSSLKFAVYHAGDDGRLEARAAGQVDGIGAEPHLRVHAADAPIDRRLSPAEGQDHAAALAVVQGWLGEYLQGGPLAAVGHRVVHGGPHFTAPVRLDATVLAALEDLVPLAPLHQPHSLAAIRALLASAPALPQVACFDTAFHQTQPALAQRFALPPEVSGALLRRYGFHGLSYEFIAGQLAGLDPLLAGGRVIVAHLGNGASLCALRAGRSIATTMGFTALDGVPMGTRSGAIDPGVLLYLLDQRGMDVRAVEDLLYNRSGLLGVSGVSSDMRTLLASPAPRAAEAVDLFVYRIGREIGSLAAALGGLDGLVFTGGIGEHAAPIRARVCRDAAWLGIELDEAANQQAGPRISSAASRASAWVVPTDENLMIARHTRQVVGCAP
ncbi:MAG: acetate/propionate family kinase [Candidatus Binatia bacterium]